MLCRILKDCEGSRDLLLVTPGWDHVALRLAGIKAGATLCVLPLGWGRGSTRWAEVKVGDVIDHMEVLDINQDDRDAIADDGMMDQERPSDRCRYLGATGDPQDEVTSVLARWTTAHKMPSQQGEPMRSRDWARIQEGDSGRGVKETEARGWLAERTCRRSKWEEERTNKRYYAAIEFSREEDRLICTATYHEV